MQEPYKDFLVRKSSLPPIRNNPGVQQVEDPPEIHRRTKSKKVSARRKQPEVSYTCWLYTMHLLCLALALMEDFPSISD